MRYFILLILSCYTYEISAQNMIDNSSFEINQGNNLMVGICPTFTDVSVPGWTVSHGTPELINGSSPDQTWHLAMWSCFDAGGPNYGEGAYNKLLSSVVSGEYYNFCFWYKTSSGPNNSTGAVVCELTNQATHNGVSCGGWPLNMAVQNITPSTATFPQPVWTYVSGSFQANANYTFLRIYPNCPNAPVNDVATLEVDGLVLYPASVCSGILNMNNNVVYDPNVGFYERYSIVAGSTAAVPNGSMMVINPAVTTIFKGNTNGYIDLVNDFSSVPDNKHYFETILGPCGCPGRSEGPERLAQNTESSYHGDLVIFPNPTTGIFTVQKKPGETETVEVLDLFGRTVIEKRLMTEDQTSLDLSTQPTGIYFVQIASGETVKVVRIVKQ